MEYKTRNDVPEQYKWDLSTRYKNNQEWEKHYNKLLKDIEKITNYKEKILTNSKTLQETLDTYFQIDSELVKLYVYADLKTSEDLSNNNNKLMLDKASNLFSKYSCFASFIEPTLLSVDEKVIKDFIEDNKGLQPYKFYIEQLLRSKKHILSEDKEKMISLLTKNYGGFHDIYNILIDSALSYGTILNDNGEEVEITSGTFSKFMQSKNRTIRKEAYEKMFTKLKEFQNIFSSLLISKYETFDSVVKVRDYDSSFNMTSFSSNIPEVVNKNLYKVVHKRIDVYQKYYKMIKKKLKLDKIYPYDLRAVLIKYDKHYSIEEAKEIIISALQYMGEDYINIIKKSFDEKWIDFCTYKGKRSGAYSASNYGDNPVVFLNYNYKLDDVSALAHELGHAVHSYYSEKNNTYFEANYDLFVAEVASLTNEILLSNYILENSENNEEKAASIYNLLDIIQNNLFDAALEGEFENILHKKVNQAESLSTEDLNNTIYNLRAKYYGDTVELIENSKYSWIRRNHYYRPFYLYKYAVGVSAACYAAKKIISKDKEFIEKYINFLKSGGKKYPVDILLDASIDVTKEEVFDSAINYFNELIDKFDELTE